GGASPARALTLRRPPARSDRPTTRTLRRERPSMRAGVVHAGIKHGPPDAARVAQATEAEQVLDACEQREMVVVADHVDAARFDVLRDQQQPYAATARGRP